jgi:hypothetical protein
MQQSLGNLSIGFNNNGGVKHVNQLSAYETNVSALINNFTSNLTKELQN